MRIQHNIMAMNSYRNYTGNNSALSKNLEKLSSGYKINRAGDDAAGLAISEKMRAQITGLKTAQSNAQSGINLVQTAEGALTEVHDMLNRMVELADQSANGTYDNSTDRANLQKEFSQLSSEIDRIADASNFNGQSLLDGSLTDATASKGTVTLDLTGLKDGDSITVNNKIYKLDSQAAAENGDGSVEDPFVLKSKSTLATKIANDTDIASASFAGDNLTITSAKAGKAGDKTSTATAKLSGATLSSDKIDVNKGKDTTTKLTLQIGDTADSFNKIQVEVKDMHVKNLGTYGDDGNLINVTVDGASKAANIKNMSIAKQADAATAVDVIKSAINQVSGTRGDLGATQNRLEHTINNLSVMTENIQDAESNIRDVDVAAEMMNYTKNNILVQSAQAMLAQANQAPQGVLQLLQ